MLNANNNSKTPNLKQQAKEQETLAKQQAKEQERLAREQLKEEERAARERAKLTQDIVGTFAKSAARSLEEVRDKTRKRLARLFICK